MAGKPERSGGIAGHSKRPLLPTLRLARQPKPAMVFANTTPVSKPSQTALSSAGSLRLRISLILALHREALAGISSYAGNFRPAGVAKFEGSKHEPVGAHLVPELIEEMCHYVNEHWEAEHAAFRLAAYIMWRLNWIHPFADGNGRTSRILSYVVLAIRASARPPGTPTMPDQIGRKSRSLFRRARRGRCRVAGERGGRVENGRAIRRYARPSNSLRGFSQDGGREDAGDRKWVLNDFVSRRARHYRRRDHAARHARAHRPRARHAEE